MPEAQDHRLRIMEEKISQLEQTQRDIERRVSGHDTAIAKIEVLVEGLKTQWNSLELDIREFMSETNRSSTSAWRDVTIEAIKTIALVAGAILAAKIFIK